MSKKTVVLLSGGIDSAVALALAKKQQHECYCLSFDYGQRHHFELRAARKLAVAMEVKDHKIIHLNLPNFTTSALTNTELPVRTINNAESFNTYVPARNTIFLSIALGFAESVGAEDIVLGSNLDDYHHYPDCRADYFDAFETMANLATASAHFRIQAPLIDLTKVQLIQLGHKLGVDFGLTSTCYDPNEKGYACGICDSCCIRRQAFEVLKLDDPAVYVQGRL